jgi:hypothetical protein
MRHFYFDDVANTVMILPEESTEYGQRIGTVSDEDFGKVNTKFLIQSFFTNAGISRTGLEVEIVYGPSINP